MSQSRNLLMQLEMMDKAGVDFNVPEKPILSRNGLVRQSSNYMATSEYLNASVTTSINTQK